MIKLICQHCLKSVSVPDDAAGKDAPCPECGKSFPVPAKYNAVVTPDTFPLAPPPPPPPVVVPPVAVVPPPPPVVPPAPPGAVLPPPPVAVAPPIPLGAGYTKAVGFSINPKTVAWLPAVCLTLVLVLSFFVPWVGSSPAGQTVHSQGLWRATFGSVNTNLKLEAQKSNLKRSWKDQVRGNWELLVPALFALAAAVALAWADRRYVTLEARQLPPPLRWLVSVWPRRKLLIAGLSALVLALIVIQVLSGFGMEKAIRKSVADDPVFVEQLAKAGSSKSEIEAVNYDIDQKVAEYALEHTFWAHLSIVLLAIAVLAIVLSAALDRRGNKPPPRIMLPYW